MAIRFDRDSVQLCVGAFTLIAIAIGLVLIVGLAAIIVPLGIGFAFAMEWRIARMRSFKRNGYFSGRRRGGPGHSRVWVYEELRDSGLETLTLELENTEPGRWELFVPSDADWRGTVPDWAENRRGEIIDRISAAFKPEDLKLPDDF